MRAYSSRRLRFTMAGIARQQAADMELEAESTHPEP